MAGAGDTPVLSSRQKQFTVRAAKKKPMKAALCSPYSVVWPHVSSDDSTYILHLLEREFGGVELRKTTAILRTEQRSEYKALKRLKPAEKKEKYSSLLKQRKAEELNLMSQLVIGFKRVTIGLEKDQLRLVLANRESWMLIQHLALLVGIRGCPGAALSGLEVCLVNRLGVPKLSTFGFKKKRLGDCSNFDKLVDDIASKCPPIHIPWLESESELLHIKSSNMNTERTRTRDETMLDMEDQSCDLDEQESSDEHRAVNPFVEEDKRGTTTRNFYQYKSQTQKKQKIIFEDSCKGNIIPLKHEGLGSSDFIAFEDTEPDCTKRKRKNKQKLLSKKKKFSKHSTWQSPDVGQMVANCGRKPVKKK